MRQRTVTILLRVKEGHGNQPYYPVVFAGNGIIKPFYARINGEVVFRKDGVYYLRYTDRNGKRHNQYAGTDPNHVRTLRAYREHIIAGEKMGLITSEPPAVPRPVKLRGQEPESVAGLVAPEAPKPDEGTNRLPLARTVDEYVREMDIVRSRKRANEYRHKLGVFVKCFRKTYLDEISDDDIVQYIATVRKLNLSTRTIANYCLTLRAFLCRYGFTDKVPKRLIPKATEKAVQAYRSEEMKCLFRVADSEEEILFRFFLGLGMREQEVMYASWKDVDFERGLFHVVDKPDVSFVIKDKEERLIPIPSHLLEALRQRYEKRTHERWIFPTEHGLPDGHLLRRLQRLAFRAGLNCGECITKGGVCCKEAPCCRRFGLHKFRRTYATFHHEAGVPVRTLMGWLGHSNLETTLRYLAAADPSSDKTRKLVDRTEEMFN